MHVERSGLEIDASMPFATHFLRMIQEYAAEMEHAVNPTHVILVSKDGLDLNVTYQNALESGRTVKTIHPALDVEHAIYLIRVTVPMGGLGQNVRPHYVLIPLPR